MSKSEGKSGSACSQPVSAPKSAVGEGEPSAALLPCPFCGSPGEAHTHLEIPTMWIAGCSEERGECIGVQAAYDFISREAAVAAWNTRDPRMVPESVYLSAVRGRHDFRRALRAERAQSSEAPSLQSEPPYDEDGPTQATPNSLPPEHSTSDQGERG